MKKSVLSTCMFVLTAGLCASAYATGGSQAADWTNQWRKDRDAALAKNPNLPYDPTSILVGCDEQALKTVLVLTGGEVIQSWRLVPDAYHISVPDADDALELLGLLKDLAGFKYAEPDHFGRIGATPNDTSYAQLWGMNNTGQTVNSDPGIAGADIDANLAWDVGTGSKSIVVGMVDSGIRNTHEDLAANIWKNTGEVAGNGVDDDGNGYIDDTWGWDFWNGDNNALDDNGHGTHTAGTVGAVGNNGKGVTGVCWSVSLAGLKIGSRSGSVSSSAGISAINYCVGKGIKLSNHSWGGTGYSATFDTAVTNARSAGHMIVCAAGNSAINNEVTPFYPASYSQDNVISVASIDNNDKLSSFSNYGSTRVDLGAPGSTIYSTYIRNNSNSAYAYLSGTSMAAPHVTGAAALVWSANPTWTYAQVRSKILSTVRPISALSGKCVTGGVLNVNNAMR